MEFDKQVLRFYGYIYVDRTWELNGPLGDPSIETAMCRHLTIFYYLESDKIEITEAAVVNSGAPAGTFYKKAPLTYTNKDPINLRDFFPGAILDILSRKFIISDMDVFTRNYYSTFLDIELPPGYDRPQAMKPNYGAQYATGLGHGYEYAETKTPYVNPDLKAIKESVIKTNKFFNLNGQLLRFQTIEVGSNHGAEYLFPELRAQYPELNIAANQPVASASAKRFVLTYDLSADTIELILQSGVAAGTTEAKLALKKSRIPKDWYEARRRPNVTPEYITPQDLRLGIILDLYGREFLLVNCDSFTKQYYARQGVKLRAVPLLQEKVDPVVHKYPAFGDGFLPIGSPEDTLGTVYGMPKPRRDERKAMRNQGRLLRCKAMLITDHPILKSRVFFITLNMEDDSVLVTEDNIRNSGIWTGTYLKRGRYMNDNCDPPRYFVSQDIFLGNVVILNGNEFRIVEMDNMSLIFCETYPDEFPMMNLQVIVVKVLSACNVRNIDFRHSADISGKATTSVTQKEFVHKLNVMGLLDTLNDQEITTVLRRFKDESTGLHFYSELCDFMSHLNAMSKESEFTYGQPPEERDELEKYFHVLRLRTLQWRRAFRLDSHVMKGKMTLTILEQILQKYKAAPLTPSVRLMLTEKYSVTSRKEALPIFKELVAMGAVANYSGDDLLNNKATKKNKQSMFKDKLDRVLNQQNDKNSSKKGKVKMGESLLRVKGSSSSSSSSSRSGSSSASSSSSRRGSRTGSDSHVAQTSSGVLYVAEGGDYTGGNGANPTRRGGGGGGGVEVELNTHPSNTLIDYELMCDDIYKADWITTNQ